jgi:hypothetical protein
MDELCGNMMLSKRRIDPCKCKISTWHESEIYFALLNSFKSIESSTKDLLQQDNAFAVVFGRLLGPQSFMPTLHGHSVEEDVCNFYPCCHIPTV